MRVATDFADITFYAWKQDNSIQIRSNKTDSRYHCTKKDTEERERGSHAKDNLLPMILTTSGDDDDDFVKEKFYKISKVKFGSHTIVTMSKVGANDSEGQEIKVAIRKEPISPSFWSFFFVKLWALGLISDSKKLVLATRNGFIVNKVHVVNSDTMTMIQFMDQMDPKARHRRFFKMGRSECVQMLDFLDRILTLIQKLITTTPAGKAGRILKFVYKRRETFEMVPVFEDEETSEKIKKGENLIDIKHKDKRMRHALFC